MYKVEWTQSLQDLIKPYHDFILETLEFVNQNPKFSVQSPTDIEELTNAIKSLSENDSSKENFSKIALKTDLPKHICNLKYENRDLLNEYKNFVSNYYNFLNKDWHVTSSYSKEVKDAFNYFYENLIHGKTFNKEFLNSDLDAIHEFRRKLALKKTCPYCDLHEMEFDSASVDHFIPKSKHPILAIYPKNLVVACTACNDRIKKEHLYLPIVHPYFTSPSDYFIFVYSHKNKKITIQFKTMLTFKDKRKLANFFRLFNLIYRYNTNKSDLYDNLIQEIQKGVNKQFKRMRNLSRELIEEIILEEIKDKEKEVRDRKGIEFLTKLKADLYTQIKKEELKCLVDYFAVKYGIENIYSQPQIQS
ncbi:HNH endonuclease [Oceanobacillus luteolus]|uniref:HNH endonuclease n=1 Tax=Oceanobacillus luteolus TaxID=1274358 RepID=UPI00203BF002|nr:HNH endonuclease [Oceanobacillus luteolus]MCM3741797.1 HNH endonuclease [Oceanobacillus luteolus]